MRRDSQLLMWRSEDLGRSWSVSASVDVVSEAVGRSSLVRLPSGRVGVAWAHTRPCSGSCAPAWHLSAISFRLLESATTADDFAGRIHLVVPEHHGAMNVELAFENGVEGSLLINTIFTAAVAQAA